MRIKQLLQRYNADDSGAVVIIVALFLTAAVGFMAVGIDLGSLYFRQKTLQAQADMAAVSAVLNLYDEAESEDDEAPRVAATQTVLGNALSAAALTGLSYGRYDYDSAVFAEDRFTEGSLTDADVNAAKAELADSAPLFFAKSFLNADSTPLSASATAARFDFASFSLGSRLLSLDTGESVLGGLLDGLLEGALDVDLDLMDYRALAAADIDLLTFSDALGNRIGATAGDYDTILTSDIDLADIAGAILDTGAVSGSTEVLTTILNTTASTGLNASDLIGIDGDNIALQLEDILGAVEVNALDLLKASLDILNEGHIIEVKKIALGIDGVTSVNLQLVVGEREAHSGWIMIGARGATLHTAQVRLKLDLEVATPTLLSGVVKVSSKFSVYVEVANATVSLVALNCNAQEDTDVIASFDTGLSEDWAGTSLVEVFIGEFLEPDFEDTTTPLASAKLTPTTLLEVSALTTSLLLGDHVASVELEAHIDVGAAEQKQVDFTREDMNNSVTRQISTGDLLETTVSSLVSETDLDVIIGARSSLLGSLLGLLLPPVDDLLDRLFGIVPEQLITELLGPVDDTIDSLLSTLGIGIGQGDLTLHNVSCGKVVLVQ